MTRVLLLVNATGVLHDTSIFALQSHAIECTAHEAKTNRLDIGQSVLACRNALVLSGHGQVDYQMTDSHVASLTMMRLGIGKGVPKTTIHLENNVLEAFERKFFEYSLGSREHVIKQVALLEQENTFLPATFGKIYYNEKDEHLGQDRARWPAQWQSSNRSTRGTATLQHRSSWATEPSRLHRQGFDTEPRGGGTGTR